MTPRIVEVAPPIDYASVTPSALLSPPPVSVLADTASHRGLIYAAVPGFRPLRLDLHLPTAGGPWPVVVYVHGGSFVGGVREMGPWASLPPHGVAVASVSYRLAGEVDFPEPVEDVRAAVRWVRRHADSWNIDRDKVSLWGSSAGALLAGIAGVSADRSIGRRVGGDDESAAVRSVITHYGIADARRVLADAVPGGGQSAVDLQLLVDLFTADSEAVPSITAHLTEGVRPDFLIVHGDADRRVGHGQSLLLDELLSSEGFATTLRIVEGADHGAAEFADTVRIEQALAFLRDSWRE